MINWSSPPVEGLGVLKGPPGPGADKASAINDASQALETGFMHLIKSVIPGLGARAGG